MTARRRSARRNELTEPIRVMLECGHWFDFLCATVLAEAPDMEDLAAVWQDHRETILASYAPPSWSEDQPCWGQYVFDLAPKHGPRRGTDPDDTDVGYFISESDAEGWKTYLRRCKAAR